MYYYLYDSFLNDKKYLRVIEKIKRTVIDLGINGKHARMSFLKSFDEMIKDEIKKGVSVVVIVGNDYTLTKVIDVIARHNIIVGLIPVGPNNNFAKFFGLLPEELACSTLAARKLQKINLGRINNIYFLSNVLLQENIDQLSIKCDDSFHIYPQRSCPQLNIYNFWNPFTKKFPNNIIEIFGQDQNFKIAIPNLATKKKIFFSKRPEQPEIFFNTYLPAQKIFVNGPSQIKAVVDDHKIYKMPLTIELVPQVLNMIVGKDRII